MAVYVAFLILCGSFVGSNDKIDSDSKAAFFAVFGVLTVLMLLFSLL